MSVYGGLRTEIPGLDSEPSVRQVDVPRPTAGPVGGWVASCRPGGRDRLVSAPSV